MYTEDLSEKEIDEAITYIENTGLKYYNISLDDDERLFVTGGIEFVVDLYHKRDTETGYFHGRTFDESEVRRSLQPYINGGNQLIGAAHRLLGIIYGQLDLFGIEKDLPIRDLSAFLLIHLERAKEEKQPL